MKRYIASLFLFFISTQAYAESPIIVNGHIFTNVNCFQKNRTVTISGRVSGGNIRGRMTIRVHVYDENGNAFANNAIIENYDGRGHLFETQVWPGYKAKQWNVGMIEVWGNRSSRVIQEQKKQDMAYLERKPEIRKENNFKFFQPNTKDIFDYAAGDVFDYAAGDIFDYAAGDVFDYAAGDIFDYAAGSIVISVYIGQHRQGWLCPRR